MTSRTCGPGALGSRSPPGRAARHRCGLVYVVQGDAALHVHRSRGTPGAESVRLLRANVTANSAEDQALLHEFQIFGPPTIALYDAQGREHQAFRVVGYMKASQFASLLHQAFATG